MKKDEKIKLLQTLSIIISWAIDATEWATTKDILDYNKNFEEEQKND